MSAGAAQAEPARRSKGLHVTLWIAQVLLAFMYLTTGVMKSTMPIPALAQSVKWAADLPVPLVRFIGISEFAGALGLLLPSLTRIRPGLTPLAALGLFTIQVLAMCFHLSRGEARVLPFNLTLCAIAAFITLGRWRKAPIAPRGYGRSDTQGDGARSRAC